ncbi:MAG: class I SAM-dependent methyltransferase [Clostridia bacterium]|nr:class I SAM-dependent methyltransferase [Clostridia bacterium]
MIYDIIAPFYDKVNREVDYVAWADFIERTVAEECAFRPELVLDLACGTGRMTLELARRGYDMTGVDASAEMLDVAREAAEAEGLEDKMLWLGQDMRSFELYGTVDLTVCCLDSINHLLSIKDIDKCLSLVHNYLVPDGLFIFDINGKYKFEEIYAQSTYAFEEDADVCIWQNDYNPRTGRCGFYITVFHEEDDGRYARFDDCDTERMYTLRSIKSALNRAGFEFIGAYSDFDKTPATDGDERIYFVARCKKD